MLIKWLVLPFGIGNYVKLLILENGCHEMIYGTVILKKSRSLEPTEKSAQEVCKEEAKEAKTHTIVLSACFIVASFGYF